MWGLGSFHIGSTCGSCSSLFIVINRTSEWDRQRSPKCVPQNMSSVGWICICLRKKGQLNSHQFNAFIDHPQQGCKLQIQPRTIQTKSLRACGLMATWEILHWGGIGSFNANISGIYSDNRLCDFLRVGRVCKDPSQYLTTESSFICHKVPWGHGGAILQPELRGKAGAHGERMTNTTSTFLHFTTILVVCLEGGWVTFKHQTWHPGDVSMGDSVSIHEYQLMATSLRWTLMKSGPPRNCCSQAKAG